MRFRRFRAGATVLLAGTVGCDGATEVDGVVRDSAGRPIAGALVTLRYEERPSVAHADSAVTDSIGAFHVGFMHEPFDIALSLSVVRAGYAPYRKQFTALDAFSDSVRLGGFTVVLPRAAAFSDSLAPPGT